MSEATNLTALVLRHVRETPDRLALVVPTLADDGSGYEETSATYGELGARICQAMAGLRGQGFGRGDRIILMAPLSVDLYALLLGTLASGMSAVFIDTGMGKDKVLSAIVDAKADALVSVGALLRYRLFLRPLWGLKKFSADSRGLGVRSLSSLFQGDGALRETAATTADDHALITFTSGSTGRPKGADRTQGLLVAQHRALAGHFPNEGHEVDMPCFPVVTLHNLCCGITTVLPAVDFRAPATVNPSFIFAQIGRWGVTQMSGAPAYIDRLADHLLARDDVEARVRRMAVGGAPTSTTLCGRIRRVFPGCEAQVVYGSTEAEPIASVDIGEILAEAPRAKTLGYLVGTTAHEADVALVNLPETTPKLGPKWLLRYRVRDGEPGELIVRGPHVNRSYLDNPAANRENKVQDPDGTVWHRTGDVARRDERGRLWLCGRVKDQVPHGDRLVHPLPVEAAVDAVVGVARSALLGRGGGAVLVYAPVSGEGGSDLGRRVTTALAEFGLEDADCREVSEIPMDYRHNSKIDRVALRQQLEA